MGESEQYKYDSVTVAKLIVATSNEKRLSINMTKVQKLLYIAYGLYLAVKGSRLTDEHPQAWPYGPVFPKTRKQLLSVDLYSISKLDASLAAIQGDNEITSLMELVFNTFGSWTATQLTNWSHSDGTPWQQTVSSKDFVWGTQIPDNDIKSHFKSMINYARE